MWVVKQFAICCLLLSHHYVTGQVNKVSSKLDFDETAENSNRNNNNQTGVPVLIGQGQGGGYDQSTGRGLNVGQTGNTGSGSGSGIGGSTSGAGGGSGNRPKIHGVRVTVDTGDGQQQTKESKESVEITDLGKHKKRVGIHTDITFEITADGEGNETSSAQQAEKEDASVPIYKGRGGSHDSKHKSRKPYDPKSQWNPNFSSEHRGYEASNRRGSGAGYYPQYYPQHVYTSGSGSGAAADAGSIYRNSADTWTHYVPVWTTERAPQEHDQIYRQPSWKPCYCMSSYGTDYRRRRDSKAGKEGQPVQAHSGVMQVVDAKLEQPFS